MHKNKQQQHAAAYQHHSGHMSYFNHYYSSQWIFIFNYMLTIYGIWFSFWVDVESVRVGIWRRRRRCDSELIWWWWTCKIVNVVLMMMTVVVTMASFPSFLILWNPEFSKIKYFHVSMRKTRREKEQRQRDDVKIENNRSWKAQNENSNCNMSVWVRLS